MRASLRRIVFISLFTALIIVGGYISLPLPVSPVPLVLADFFILLAGLTLGATGGGTATGLFVLLGVLGLPVFAGGKAGMGVLFGPTGGFVAGYLLEALLAGWVAHWGPPSRWKDALAIGVGLVALFGCGTGWLIISRHLSLAKAMAVGLLPFLPGSAIKAAVSWWVVCPLRELINNPE